MGKTLIVITLVILIASSLVLFGFLHFGLYEKILSCYDLITDREWVKAAVQASPWTFALMFIGLQIGQVLFAPIPGELTGFIGGYAFGVVNGFLLSTFGLTTGSMINFAIGHFLGEHVVRRLVRQETYDKYNRMVQYKGVLVIFLLFLIPGFPKDYLCMFLGLTSMPARVFFVISTVGRIPGTLALSLQGASIYEKDYLFFVIITGLSLLFALGGILSRDRLYRWMARMNHKAN